jgi:hypothetical protein
MPVLPEKHGRGGLLRAASLLLAAAIFSAGASRGNEALLATPLLTSGKYFFIPNQSKATVWNPTNGNIEGSFSNLSLWPRLQDHLVGNRGGIGIYAPEIQNTSEATLTAFRAKGLLIAVEAPGMTQCADGYAVADAELDGASNEVTQLFDGMPGRSYQLEKNGWFKTREGKPFTPDEIILDERYFALLPFLSHTPPDRCPNFASFNPGLDRVSGLINDYAEYAIKVRAKWPNNTPRVSLYWVVVPEFSDEVSLSILERTINAMCDAAGSVCPETVYVDAHWSIPSPELLSLFSKIKSIVARRGVHFGIVLAGDSHYIPSKQMRIETADKLGTAVQACVECTNNQLFQNSEIAILRWLLDNEVVESKTRLHIQSWDKYPNESGLGVAEFVRFSLADTANRLLDILIQRGLAR